MTETNPPGWIPPELWRPIQNNTVIPCVDIYPVRLASHSYPTIEAVGLILRKDPNGKPVWCHIGGRVNKGELIHESLDRHLKDTLGPNIRFKQVPEEEPTNIVLYEHTSNFKYKRRGVGGFDKRQQALALTFVKRVEGDIEPQNEALDFKWFAPDEFPPDEEFWPGVKGVMNVTLHKFVKRLEKLTAPPNPIEVPEEFTPIYWQYNKELYTDHYLYMRDILAASLYRRLRQPYDRRSALQTRALEDYVYKLELAESINLIFPKL